MVLLAASGCGGSERDAMRKRMSSLQDEVNLLQNTVDRLEERLAAVEMQERARPAIPASNASEGAGTIERPRLKVIRLEPGAETGGAGPSQPSETGPDREPADEPRPVIRGAGDRVETELPPGPTSRLQWPGDRSRAGLPPASQSVRAGRTEPRYDTWSKRGERA